MTTMNNMTELRDALAQSFKQLQEGDIDPKVMSELSNAAGKMINTTKVQIEYNTMTGSDRKIKFLECE